MSVAVNDPYDLNTVVALFQGILGGAINGGGPAEDPYGQRRITWDGRALPFYMPSNFFANGFVDRGLTVVSKTNKFVVSNPSDGSDYLFDSINPEASKDFTAFSAPRLFAALDDTEIELLFSVPGTNGAKKGFISGFGAVLVDVDLESTTEIIMKDSDGCEIASGFVEPNPGGFSFLGLKVDDKVVSTVEMYLGTEELDGEESDSFTRDRALKKGKKDIVVMDDFLYDEPTYFKW